MRWRLKGGSFHLSFADWSGRGVEVECATKVMAKADTNAGQNIAETMRLGLVSLSVSGIRKFALWIAAFVPNAPTTY